VIKALTEIKIFKKANMFVSVRPNKVADYIVEQIRMAILENKLRPGDKLASEKELQETFKVGKATLREALRSLEVLGFIEIRKGVTGGSFITEVGLKKARDHFTNFLHFKNFSLSDLSEIRLLIEPYIAKKAAMAISNDDLGKLGKFTEEFDLNPKNKINIEYYNKQIEFHQILAGITRNPFLIFILDFIINLLIDAKEVLQPEKGFYEKVLRAHKRIYKALLERDPQKAYQEMIKHVQEEEKDLIELQMKRSIPSIDMEPPTIFWLAKPKM
jgi:GntR family transcriptional repressor for pyruvate dehydrogenase complex